MEKFNFIKAALIIAIIGVMALSSYALLVISPKYTDLLVENTEEEAIRTGAHLSFMLFGKGEGAITQDSLSKVNVAMIMEDTRLLVIQKLNIFSSSGEILFSTDKKEIGKVNRKDYFFRVVAKGKPYTKTVSKNSETASGSISETDLVETYIPIMRQEKFAGAFEIYYDISKRKSKLSALVKRMYWTIFPSSLALLGIIVFLSLKANKNFEKLRETELKLHRAYTEMEQKVISRTDALQQANVQLEKEIEDRKQYEKQMIQATDVVVFDYQRHLGGRDMEPPKKW